MDRSAECASEDFRARAGALCLHDLDVELNLFTVQEC